jgi:hypothetical protein
MSLSNDQHGIRMTYWSNRWHSLQVAERSTSALLTKR